MLQKHRQQLAAAPPVVRRNSSPIAALLLSFLAPGLGAAYNGQTSKALVHFGIFASFFQIAVVTGDLFFVLGVIATLLIAAVDAYRTAQLIRAGLTPAAELDLIGRKLYGNPLAWSLTLLLLGTIFLLHTVFGISLPMRPLFAVMIVLLGAYTLYDYLRTRLRRKRKAADFNFAQTPSSVGAFGSTTASSSLYDAGDIATRVAARPFDERRSL